MVDTFLGDAALARALAGHPDTTEVSVDELKAALEFGHDQLILYTGKTDWSPSDPQIDQLKRIEEHFAASYIKSWWRDPDKMSNVLYNRAVTMCTKVIENQTVSGADLNSYTSQTYQYRTAALNPNAMRYSSPRVDV